MGVCIDPVHASQEIEGAKKTDLYQDKTAHDAKSPNANKPLPDPPKREGPDQKATLVSQHQPPHC